MNKHKIVLKKKNKRVVFNQKEPIVVVKQIQAKGRNEERGTIQRVTVRKE